MRRLFFLAWVAVALGCSPEKGGEAAVRISAEELADCVCSIATNGMPVATGFFVTRADVDGKDHHYLVTARHMRDKLESSDVEMMIPDRDRTGSIVELCFGSWRVDSQGGDACVMDVTEQARSVVERGCCLRTIRLEDSAASAGNTGVVNSVGIGFLRRGDFRVAGVGLGSESFALVSGTEIWEGLAEKGEVPITYRGGRVANVPHGLATLGRDRGKGNPFPNTELFALDFPAIGGMSGAPVFVSGTNGAPCLAGVMVSIVPAHKETELVRAGSLTAEKMTNGNYRFKYSIFTNRPNTFLSYAVHLDAVLRCIDSGNMGSCEDLMRNMNSLTEDMP